MSESNGAVRPAGSPYRRAVERHRAERAAWQRVRAARIELAAAVADYDLFCQGVPLPAARPLVNGLVDLVDMHARMRNPELTEAFLAEKEADRHAELADEGLTEEAADGKNLPFAVEPMWGRPCHFFVELVTADGISQIRVDHDQRDHIELRGDFISSTGFRSNYLTDSLVGKGSLFDFALGLCRVRARREGHRPIDPSGLPSWRRQPIEVLSDEKAWRKRNLAGFKKAKISTLGELSDEIEFAACFEAMECGASVPACDRVVAVFEAYTEATSVRPPAQPDPALDRLGKLLDGQDPSRQTDGQADQGLPPWTSEDLDRELLHALGDGPMAETRPCWKKLIESGAINLEIGAAMATIWPRSRRHVEADPAAGRKLGYTIQIHHSIDCVDGYFWLGHFRGNGHQCTLHGTELIDRIRSVLKIPTPTEARRAAKESFREPTITQKRKGGGLAISPPDLGWTEDEQVHAAILLGVSVDNLIICDNCESARARQLHPCPVCQSQHYRLRDTPAVYAGPLHKESGTSKVPPASVEMPKRGRNPNGMANPAWPGKHWLAITAPEEGWDDANLANAAEDLETDLGHVNLCNKCSAARRIAIHPCPMCGSPEYRAALGGINGEPVPQPAKRGRGRPRKEPVS